MRLDMTQTELKESINLLKELQEQLEPLANQVTDLINRVGDDNARHYVVAPLQIAVMREHGWLTRDNSLLDVIERWEDALASSQQVNGDLTEDEEDEDEADD